MITATSLPVLSPDVLAACSADNDEEVVAVLLSGRGCIDVVVSSSSDRTVVVLRPVPERELPSALTVVVDDLRRRVDRVVEADVSPRAAAVVEVVLDSLSSTVVVVLSTVVVPLRVVEVGSASGLEVLEEDAVEGGGRVETWAGAGATDAVTRTTTMATVTTTRWTRRVATTAVGAGVASGSRPTTPCRRSLPARPRPPTPAW